MSRRSKPGFTTRRPWLALGLVAAVLAVNLVTPIPARADDDGDWDDHGWSGHGREHRHWHRHRPHYFGPFFAPGPVVVYPSAGFGVPYGYYLPPPTYAEPSFNLVFPIRIK